MWTEGAVLFQFGGQVKKNSTRGYSYLLGKLGNLNGRRNLTCSDKRKNS